MPDSNRKARVDLSSYSPKKAQLVGKRTGNLNSLVFQINPSSIRESLQTNVNSISTINSNIPRHILTGSSGRRVSFTMLLHGMLPESGANLPGSYQLDDDRTFGFKDRLLETATSIVPFKENIVKGVKTIGDIAGFDIFSDGEFMIQSRFTSTDVDAAVDKLYKLQVSGSGQLTFERVQVKGYESYTGIDFYITEVTVNRRLWDKDLKTQFAEVNISLVQAGVDGKVDRFFKSTTR